jgi:hypothetical protein
MTPDRATLEAATPKCQEAAGNRSCNARLVYGATNRRWVRPVHGPVMAAATLVKQQRSAA